MKFRHDPCMHPKDRLPTQPAEHDQVFPHRHEGNSEVQCSSSEPFEIHRGVKQGCVIAPTHFGIFFGLLLEHAFDITKQGIYLPTRLDGELFNLARLRAETKVRKVLIRDMQFADDAAVATHTQE